MGLALVPVPLPAFCDHVVHVLGMGTEEKVVGIDARRVVAAVAHEQAEWVESASQFPRNYMGRPDPLCAKSERAIAAYRVLGPRPQPASCSEFRMDRPIFVDLRPEPIVGSFMFSHSIKYNTIVDKTPVQRGQKWATSP